MRCLFVFCLGFFLLVMAPVKAAELDFGRYHALVIGINDYAHLPKLETAVNDARAVHEVLTREYGYRSTLLLNAKRRDLMQALDRLRAELDERDNLLIYYAGHGVLDKPTGEGFWLPANAEEDSQVEWIPVSTVTRMLKAVLAKHAIVVADSCYSGTLTRDAPVALRTGPERLAELIRISKKRARKALTSGGLEPVVDSGGKGHSVFTQALLDALTGNEEVLDGYQLYRKLRRKVVLNARQTPQYSEIRFAGDEGGDFLFVPLKAMGRQASAAPAAKDAAPAGNNAAIEKLIGNTIDIQAKNGVRHRLYFRSDGFIDGSRSDKGSRVGIKKWWLGENGKLCRTAGPDNRKRCEKIEVDQDTGQVKFFRSNGQVRFTAKLLKGRRMIE